MSVHPIAAAEAAARLDLFSAVIDARSEGEYAEDHLPGAINWPSLNDAERIRVGTLYKQEGAFAAQKVGAALVAKNIASHIEHAVLDKARDWQPLIYCWRGGKRSNSLALVLGQIGFKVHVIEGGYKAFRAAVLADMPSLATRLHYKVICGPTGSGKTRLLHALAQAGAQTLDLEDLACHRSSVLGLIPGQPQPTQKRFDTLIWSALRKLDPQRPVYVEAESKKVGNVTVPDALMTAMRASACVLLQLSQAQRVALLLEDYPFFSTDPSYFCQRLDALTTLRGKEVVENWKTWVGAGNLEPVVRELLELHYDPGYATSTRRNFKQFEGAAVVAPQDRSAQAMLRLAQQMVAGD